MLLVNAFGRIVEVIDEDRIKKLLLSGRMRKATPEEIEAYNQKQESRAREVGQVDTDNSFLFMSVPSSPDGYGMSRDLLKFELFKRNIHLTEQFTGQKVGLLYSYPYAVNQMPTDIRIIYTMFESDKIPDDWVEYLKEADEVLVPSHFCQDTFKRAGIESTVVPLGYNSRVFQYIDRPIPVDNYQDFTFLCYNSFNIRKGFSELLKAFSEEFAIHEPVKLILKTTLEHLPVPIPPSSYPNIEVINKKVSEKGLSDILGRSHCFVYPSRGEGFGITPLEAMATGIPAIVPNAHGIAEYFDSDYMLEAKIGDLCPALYNRFKGEDVGKMVVCSIPELRRQMRYAYNHQTEMKELGKKASEYVTRWIYKNTAAQLEGILKKWQESTPTKRSDNKYLRVERI